MLLISKDKIFYTIISVLVVILFLILMFSKCGQKPPKPIIHTDTIIQTIKVHDTIYIKPNYIVTVYDTLWITNTEYVPDTNYQGLLLQYAKLGTAYFAKNVYTTKFPIESYGSVSVTDTISKNKVVSNFLITDLKIPEKIITIHEPIPPTNQLYVGGALSGSNTAILNGVQAGVLFKDKKDRIYGAHVGWNNGLQYTISSYWKIKFK